MTPKDADPSGKTEGAISGILKMGVSASLILITAGTVISFVHAGGYGHQAADVRRLIGPEGSFPRTVGWLLGGLRQLSGQAIIVAGLIILIATPVIRVAVSIVTFARERDRAYVVICAVVLILLLISFEIGRSL